MGVESGYIEDSLGVNPAVPGAKNKGPSFSKAGKGPQGQKRHADVIGNAIRIKRPVRKESYPVHCGVGRERPLFPTTYIRHWDEIGPRIAMNGHTRITLTNAASPTQKSALSAIGTQSLLGSGSSGPFLEFGWAQQRGRQMIAGREKAKPLLASPQNLTAAQP